MLSATPQTFAQLQYNVTEEGIPLSPKNCELESCWLQEKTAQDPPYRQSNVQGQHQIHTRQVMIKEDTLSAEGMYLNIHRLLCTLSIKYEIGEKLSDHKSELCHRECICFT